MKFIKLRNGSAIRADTVVGVRVAEGYYTPTDTMPCRIIIDIKIANTYFSTVVCCGSAEERDTMAADILAEVEAAMGAPEDAENQDIENMIQLHTLSEIQLP